MDEVYFLIRFTPFWSIPGLLIAGEFAYLFWLRKKKKMMMICATICGLSVLSTISYYILGGPEKSVKFAIGIVDYLTR